jgi:CheY-like chemotaxis protein
LAATPILVIGSPNDWSDYESGSINVPIHFVAKPARRHSLLAGIAAALNHGASSPEAVSGPSNTSTRMRVLVAEDNKVNQWVTRTVLEKLGCEVEIVESGEDACSAAARVSYHCIFMDCHMPGMDGVEAAKRIRVHSAVPIIGLSASTQDEQRRACLDAGMDAFVTKPVSRSGLERVLQNFRPKAEEDAISLVAPAALLQ